MSTHQMLHAMSCEYPEGCSCGASKYNDLVARLAATEAELERVKGERLPHSCCDGHELIRFSNGPAEESESCPVCVVLAELTALRARVQLADTSLVAALKDVQFLSANPMKGDWTDFGAVATDALKAWSAPSVATDKTL